MEAKEILAKIESINEERFKDMNGRSIISVSKVQEYVSTPFDKEKQALVCEQKGKDNPNYKYAGMTAAQIIEKWEATADESKRYGSLSDEYTEQRLYGTPESLAIWKLDNNFDYDERLKSCCTGFDEFLADIGTYGFEPVGREITVYGQTESGNVVVGRIDCLFYNKATEKFLVVDWKTTEDIKTEAFRNKRLLGPAFVLEDCDLSKYSIQVQTYMSDLIRTYALTDEAHISCAIVNLRRQADGPGGRHYIVYKPKNVFTPKLIWDIVDFSISKRSLEKAMADAQAKTENKEG